jgi:hypothetical protein
LPDIASRTHWLRLKDIILIISIDLSLFKFIINKWLFYPILTFLSSLWILIIFFKIKTSSIYYFGLILKILPY